MVFVGIYLRILDMCAIDAVIHLIVLEAVRFNALCKCNNRLQEIAHE